jgi:hypothetical protein
MADIRTLVYNLDRSGDLQLIARDPRVQFGTPARQYLGPEFLPNRIVPFNDFTEELIRYRTIIANATDRYSPPQLKGGALFGSFRVHLADSNRASQLTGADYDGLLRILGNSADSMAAVAQIIDFVNSTINVPLEEWNERARWQAIETAVVQLRGDNGYSEDVGYLDPAGHRAVAGGTWSDDTYDPFDDLFAMANLATSIGYTITRTVTSRKVMSILANNAKVQARTGRIVLPLGTGGVSVAQGRATLDQIGAAMMQDGLPVPQLYDLRYRTETGDARFMSDTTFIMFAETGRDPGLDQGDLALLAPEILDRLGNTVGYTAIGRAVGQNTPGRFIRSAFKEDIPARVYAEGVQTSLPVITEPFAIFVIKSIA